MRNPRVLNTPRECQDELSFLLSFSILRPSVSLSLRETVLPMWTKRLNHDKGIVFLYPNLQDIYLLETIPDIEKSRSSNLPNVLNPSIILYETRRGRLASSFQENFSCIKDRKSEKDFSVVLSTILKYLQNP